MYVQQLWKKKHLLGLAIKNRCGLDFHISSVRHVILPNWAKMSQQTPAQIWFGEDLFQGDHPSLSLAQVQHILNIVWSSVARLSHIPAISLCLLDGNSTLELFTGSFVKIEPLRFCKD
jgi:hypothetical protein